MASMLSPCQYSAKLKSPEFYGNLRLPTGTTQKQQWHSKFNQHSHIRRTIRCSATDLPSIVKQLGLSLWGQGLPPGALVGAVRSVWNTGWTVMMQQLAPSDTQGAYQRPKSKFRNRLKTPVQSSDYGRYHLYVSLTCPWAHRAAIVHTLKGLGDAVPLSVVVPSSTGLWEFNPQQGNGNEHVLQPTIDKAHRCRQLIDVYKLRKGGYDGRATVPLLWDSVEQDVVNNESADIIEILNSDFNPLASNPELDLAPPQLVDDIDKWNSIIYPKINNGVYRCGFGQGQQAYETALNDLFSALDMLEEHLSLSRYLCNDNLTLADVRLFTTLYRFDPVYYILFKCSKRKISEYPNLYGYLRDLYQVSNISVTCDLQTIMDGYYKVLFPLNPGGISPGTPRASESAMLMSAHKREAMSKEFSC